jgi:hypothetical protein
MWGPAGNYFKSRFNGCDGSNRKYYQEEFVQKIRSYFFTEDGIKRKEEEVAFLLKKLPRGKLFWHGPRLNAEYYWKLGEEYEHYMYFAYSLVSLYFVENEIALDRLLEPEFFVLCERYVPQITISDFFEEIYPKKIYKKMRKYFAKAKRKFSLYFFYSVSDLIEQNIFFLLFLLRVKKLKVKILSHILTTGVIFLLCCFCYLL